MMMLKYLLVTLFFFGFVQINGQSNLPGKKDINDTSLLQSFKKGEIEGHFRMFYMMTDNSGPLTDYYALAFGGRLKYETKSFKRFQLGLGGYFTWNLSSSDLTKPDTITKMMNRYEVGLFDLTDPARKKDLVGLENLFIKYNFKSSSIKFGKQIINTPFINKQDGRMQANAEQGLWIEVKEIRKTKIELGWLSHISPRSTLKWYKGASSIGVYPSGVSITDHKSDYKNNLSSYGTAVAGITYSINKQIKLHAWNYWVENIFNTAQGQIDGEFRVANSKKLLAAAQYTHQSAIHNGGNPDPSKTYFDPTQKVNIYSCRIGLQSEGSTLRFNYTRITNEGRFLFPREWGREPLFTFLVRERNEGLGDVSAFTLNFLKDFFHHKLTTEISGGYYDLPDVKNARLNKYGLPSYYQFNVDLKYSFMGFMKGLNMELLYLYKKGKGNIYEDLKYVINKTDMQQVNVIINFSF